jgi:glycosyltransferase involved in cell wall biosynthesis
MKILIATGIFAPEIGGPATYSKLIAEIAQRKGHTVEIITYAEQTEEVKKYLARLPYNVYPVFRTLPKGVRHIKYFWFVFQHARVNDVVYAQDPVSAGLPAYVATLLAGKKFIVRIAGDYAWEQSIQRFGVADLLDEFLTKHYGFRVELLRKVQTFIVRHASGVVVPSKYLKNVLERWGIEAKLITIIYNAVAMPEVTVSKNEVRERLKVRGFVLLCVGRMVPWKGFEMLIRLIPKLVERIPETKLIIVGTGPEYQKLLALTHSLQMQQYITFLGSLSHETLAQYYRACDIFLLNTGYEGLSHELIEVMSIGVPIVTTSTGGNAEIARDQENALIVEYNNSEAWLHGIMRLYSDTALRDRISQPQDVSKLVNSPENLVEQTLNFLQL